jgi:hypothetical protein
VPPSPNPSQNQSPNPSRLALLSPSPRLRYESTSPHRRPQSPLYPFLIARPGIPRKAPSPSPKPPRHPPSKPLCKLPRSPLPLRSLPNPLPLYRLSGMARQALHPSLCPPPPPRSCPGPRRHRRSRRPGRKRRPRQERKRSGAVPPRQWLPRGRLQQLRPRLPMGGHWELRGRGDFVCKVECILFIHCPYVCLSCL